jgi:hypothetical protein
MNEELLAAIALFFHSGSLLVSFKIKLAYGLQTVKTLMFGLRYAGCYLQLSSVKPTQVSNGGTSKGNWKPQFSIEKADSLAAVSFTKFAPLTLLANLCSHLPEEIGLFQ